MARFEYVKAGLDPMMMPGDLIEYPDSEFKYHLRC